MALETKTKGSGCTAGKEKLEIRPACLSHDDKLISNHAVVSLLTLPLLLLLLVILVVFR